MELASRDFRHESSGNWLSSFGTTKTKFRQRLYHSWEMSTNWWKVVNRLLLLVGKEQKRTNTSRCESQINRSDLYWCWDCWKELNGFWKRCIKCINIYNKMVVGLVICFLWPRFIVLCQKLKWLKDLGCIIGSTLDYGVRWEFTKYASSFWKVYDH